MSQREEQNVSDVVTALEETSLEEHNRGSERSPSIATTTAATAGSTVGARSDSEQTAATDGASEQTAGDKPSEEKPSEEKTGDKPQPGSGAGKVAPDAKGRKGRRGGRSRRRRRRSNSTKNNTDKKWNSAKERQKTHIYVAKYPSTWDEKTLTEIFGKYGTVTHAKCLSNVRTGKSMGAGFVHFKDADSAEAAVAAMSGFVPEGSSEGLEVRRALPRGSGKMSRGRRYLKAQQRFGANGGNQTPAMRAPTPMPIMHPGNIYQGPQFYGIHPGYYHQMGTVDVYGQPIRPGQPRPMQGQVELARPTNYMGSPLLGTSRPPVSQMNQGAAPFVPGRQFQNVGHPHHGIAMPPHDSRVVYRQPNNNRMQRHPGVPQIGRYHHRVPRGRGRPRPFVPRGRGRPMHPATRRDRGQAYERQLDALWSSTDTKPAVPVGSVTVMPVTVPAPTAATVGASTPVAAPQIAQPPTVTETPTA